MVTVFGAATATVGVEPSPAVADNTASGRRMPFLAGSGTGAAVAPAAVAPTTRGRVG
jgi:hypothetical protein